MSARTARRIGRIIRRAPDPTAPEVRAAVGTEVMHGIGRRPVRFVLRCARRDPGHGPSVIHNGGKR